MIKRTLMSAPAYSPPLEPSRTALFHAQRGCISQYAGSTRKPVSPCFWNIHASLHLLSSQSLSLPSSALSTPLCLSQTPTPPPYHSAFFPLSRNSDSALLNTWIFLILFRDFLIASASIFFFQPCGHVFATSSGPLRHPVYTQEGLTAVCSLAAWSVFSLVIACLWKCPYKGRPTPHRRGLSPSLSATAAHPQCPLGEAAIPLRRKTQNEWMCLHWITNCACQVVMKKNRTILSSIFDLIHPEAISPGLPIPYSASRVT